MDDIVFEYLLLIFGTPVLMGLLWIVSVIMQRIKWRPFKKKYDAQAKQATDTAFTMITKPDIKCLLLGCLVFWFVFLAVGVLFGIAACITKDRQYVPYFIVDVILQVIFLPLILLVIHYFTKKICFADNEFVIKSLVCVKRVEFEQITSVEEIEHSEKYSALKVTYNKVTKNKVKTKTIKISQTLGNYDNAKNRFVAVQLLAPIISTQSEEQI